MTLAPFPPESRMRWRRIDVPGREDARFVQTGSGWRIAGQVHVEESGAASLSYEIDCDHAWRTRSAHVDGVAASRPFQLELVVREDRWLRNGEVIPELAGAIDVDLGFTPATNTLPIRRLQLEVGQSAPVMSAWLRFPELALELLEQTYTRESERRYRYVAQVDGAAFTAGLETDVVGRVLHYEGLWLAESVIPAI